MRALLDDPGRSRQEPETSRSLRPLLAGGGGVGVRMNDKRPGALTPRDIGLLAAAAALILDQGSKLLMLYAFGFAQMAHACHEYSDPVSVLPFFNLAMVWNCGVSYGLFP